MPDIGGRLSDDDKAKIEKWFKGLNIDQCSTCKRSGAWWYVGEFAVALSASMPRARPFSYYPAFLIVCHKCGQMRTFHAASANLQLEWPS